MARRGDDLREHILGEAKTVFLELGFERTTMDLVAARASTSKRSLYAHFETKDVLFAAVIERIQTLFVGRIKTPEHYADDPADAVVLFCGRFAQMLTWGPVLRTCRLGIAEAERLPVAASGLYEAFFGATRDRAAAFLADRFALDPAESARWAEEVLVSALYPWFPRALFGLEDLRAEVPDERTIAADVDLGPVRRTLTDLLEARGALAP